MSLSFLVEHLRDLVGAQTRFDWSLPFNFVLHLLSIPAFIALLWSQVRLRPRFWQGAEGRTSVLALAMLALGLTVFLAAESGIYTHPTSARYFMSYGVFAALLPFLLGRLHPGIFSGPRILAAGFALFVLFHPLSIENRSINSLFTFREFRFYREFLEREVGHKNLVVIAERPGQYVALGYGAMNFDRVRNDPGHVIENLRRHLVRDVFVFQRVLYATSQAHEEDRVPKELPLVGLRELQNNEFEFLRISRVVLPDMRPGLK